MLRQFQITHWFTRFAAAVVVLTAGTFVAADSAGPTPAIPRTPPAPSCSAPANLARLDRPLVRTMRQLAAGLPITIVAIGSSSTAGAGASSPARSYPNRLGTALNKLFPDHAIEVLNRGVNGEETADMMARFNRDVLAEHPDLILWQVGTNALLRGRDTRMAGGVIHEGLMRLKASGADIVLIDPQFVPQVIAKAEAPGMNSIIAAVAKQDDVNLFHRFAVMENWHQASAIPFETFVTADDLHMNDWGYGCVAKILADAIADAASRPTLTASARTR